MTDTQIKDYLKKYRIASEEQLAKHIEELKRNTIPNNEIIFTLVDLLLNEKSVLNSFFAENKKQEMYTRTVTPFFLGEMLGKCSPQCFCDGSCKKPQEKNTNSTRHKSQAGETHKENEDTIKIISYNEEDVQEGGWVGKNGTKFRVKTNKILKPLDVITINELWGLYLIIEEVNGYDCTLRIMNSENDEYIQYPCELLNGKPDYHIISNSYTKEYISKIKNRISAEKGQKDDVITNSNRGEKETMEYLQGVKESQSVDKAPIFTYCKVNKNALEALSLRALYGHIKYKETDQDWQNFTRVPNALEEYANASFRHALGIGEEDEETHLVAEAWNAVAKLEVFLRNKLNKS